MTARELQPCGTNAAWHRHYLHGEPIDDACRDAHLAYRTARRHPPAEGTAEPRRLVITVHGKPAPQGSKRHVGNGVMIESSKRLRPWREDVKAAALTVLNGQPRIEDAPVCAHITFCFDKPLRAPKRRPIWPITRSSGDVDKLVRAVFDALTDAGVWRDDAQVISVTADKIHTDDPDAPLRVPGAVVRIWEVAA